MTLALPVLLLAAQTFANAVVVTADVPHHTLTFTRNGGPTEVLVVDDAAAAALATLKPGDEVILTLSGDAGASLVVSRIERSVRGTRPQRRFRPARTGRSPSPPPASPSPAAKATPAAKTTPATPPAASASPSPSDRPPTDTVGPLQDPRKGAQQDPRDNPNRDPRVVPGLTEPPSPVPSPTPTPN